MTNREALFVSMLQNLEEETLPLVFADCVEENGEDDLANHIRGCSNHWTRLFACLVQWSFPPGIWLDLFRHKIAGYIEPPEGFCRPAFFEHLQIPESPTGPILVNVRFDKAPLGTHRIILPAINILHNFSIHADSPGWPVPVVVSAGSFANQTIWIHQTIDPRGSYSYQPPNYLVELRKLAITFSGPSNGNYSLLATVSHDPRLDWQ